MSKISKNLLAVILVTVIAIVTLLVFMARQALVTLTDDILTEQANSYITILKSDFRELNVEAEYLFDMIGGDTELKQALIDGSSDTIKDIYSNYASDESSFGAFYGSDGSLLWKTDNCPKNITVDNAPNGLGADSENMYYCYSEKIAEAGSYLIGYDLRAYEYLDPIRDKTGGHFTIFKDNVRYATTITDESGERFTGTEMSADISQAVINDGKLYSGKAEINGENYVVSYEPMTDKNGTVIGAYFGGYATSTVNEMLNKEVSVMGITGAVAAIIACVAAVFVCYLIIKKTILTPVALIGKMTKEMSEGNLGYELENISHSKDEVGELLSSVDGMRNSLSAYVNDISRVMHTMANGDFTATPQVEYKGDFVALSESAAQINNQMRNVISSIYRTSDNVYNGSTQSAEGSNALADGTTRQAAAIEQLTANLTNISQNVTDTAENARAASELADNASDILNEQHAYMNQMVDSMRKIAETSSEIESIIRAIDDIASQTNILALNAAIESARAGEAGKGFAVVADEVRNLSAKSAEAVKETSMLIEAATRAVDEGSKIADKNAASLNKVVEIFGETKKMIGDISSAADNQSRSISQITSGLGEISDVVSQNSATAEEIAASCQELNNRAIDLKDEVKLFRL